jgi:hypothetical protein
VKKCSKKKTPVLWYSWVLGSRRKDRERECSFSRRYWYMPESKLQPQEHNVVWRPSHRCLRMSRENRNQVAVSAEMDRSKARWIVVQAGRTAREKQRSGQRLVGTSWSR